MFYLRDLYPQMGMIGTREKSIMNREEQVAHHGVTKPVPAYSIWIVLLLMVGVVVVTGWMKK